MNCSADRIQPLRLVKAACNRKSPCIHRSKLSSQLRIHGAWSAGLMGCGSLLSWDSLEGISLPQGSHRCRILMALGWLNTCVASSCSNLRPQMIFFHFLPMYIWLGYLFIFLKYFIWFVFPGMVWLGFSWAQSSELLVTHNAIPSEGQHIFSCLPKSWALMPSHLYLRVESPWRTLLNWVTNTLLMVQVMSPCQRYLFSHLSAKLSDHCYWCTDCYKWPCSSK